MNGIEKIVDMSSREKILKAINAARPEAKPHPGLFSGPMPADDLQKAFTEVLGTMNASVTLSDFETIKQWLGDHVPVGGRWVNAVPELGYVDEKLSEVPAAELEDVYVYTVMGTLGVAENGAIWVPESAMIHRALPFICQQLVMIIPLQSLVPTMHEAYATVDTAADGYGAFIAGPSKTADIEQSLVIGAHGPIALQVFLVS